MLLTFEGSATEHQKISSNISVNESEQFVEVNHWHFSVALGGGKITNPLHNGKDIPLILLPYIHYYNERFFIENNVMGYSLLQKENWILSAVSQLNREAMFFHDWQPKHLLTPNFSESIISGGDQSPVSAKEIKKRKWAIDAGMQLNWFATDSIEIKAQLLHDINGVYDGFNGNIDITKRFRFSSLNQMNVFLNIGAKWQSRELITYYYGLNKQDGVDFFNFYQANSGINTHIALSATYKLNQHWRVKLNVKKEYLSQSIIDSPLLKEQHVTSGFIGVVYAF